MHRRADLARSRVRGAVVGGPVALVPSPRQSRRGADRYCYLVRSHPQDELGIALSMTDRQEQPHGVGADLTIFRITCSTGTRPAEASAQEADVLPTQDDSLAHPQPGVPHQAIMAMSTAPRLWGAGSALKAAALTRTRFLRRREIDALYYIGIHWPTYTEYWPYGWAQGGFTYGSKSYSLDFCL